MHIIVKECFQTFDFKWMKILLCLWGAALIRQFGDFLPSGVLTFIERHRVPGGLTRRVCMAGSKLPAGLDTRLRTPACGLHPSAQRHEAGWDTLFTHHGEHMFLCGGKNYSMIVFYNYESKSEVKRSIHDMCLLLVPPRTLLKQE